MNKPTSRQAAITMTKYMHAFVFVVALVSLDAAQTAVKKINIAVLDLEGKGISSIEASVLGDKLRNELILTEKFDVIERGQMQSILKEQGFQQTGCTSSECAIEAGS